MGEEMGRRGWGKKWVEEEGGKNRVGEDGGRIV